MSHKKGDWAERIRLEQLEKAKHQEVDLHAQQEKLARREEARRALERQEAEEQARREAKRHAEREAARLEKERKALEELQLRLAEEAKLEREKEELELRETQLIFDASHQHIDDFDPESKEYLKKYPKSIRNRAAKETFFLPDAPKNIPEGVNYGEYNIAKGLIAGTAVFFTAPWYSASKQMHLADEKAFEKEFKDREEKGEKPPENPQGASALTKTGAAFYGFGIGVVHGTIGGISLMTVGCGMGGEQLSRGVFCAPPIPGQGLDLQSNWRHVIYSRTLDIAQLRTPETFQQELDECIKNGLIPEHKYDIYGKKVDYTYQFFLTDEPKDMVDGFGGLQYNSVKGFVAGVTLAACAPMCDAIEQANEVDEDGNAGGFEGGVKGFGEGIVRGVVGGFTLWGAGMYYGTVQMGKGFVTLDNLAVMVQTGDSLTQDIHRINDDPIERMVYQKGHGLEEILMREERQKWDKVHEGIPWNNKYYGWEHMHDSVLQDLIAEVENDLSPVENPSAVEVAEQ